MLATVATTVALLAACGGTDGGGADAPSASPPTPTPGADTARVPLTELGTRTYLGLPGGLYPAGANVPPDAHAAAGLDRARRVQPLDPQGRPSVAGKVVLLSIGMSNTTQEFCSAGGAPPCDAWTFVGQAAAD